MIVMDDLELVVINKRVSAGKRLWKQKQRKISYSNEISRAENALFVDDKDLADLVKCREDIDDKIVKHIDDVLLESRKGIVEELSLKDETVKVLELVLENLTNSHGLTVSVGDSEKWVLDNEELGLMVSNLMFRIKEI